MKILLCNNIAEVILHDKIHGYNSVTQHGKIQRVVG